MEDYIKEIFIETAGTLKNFISKDERMLVTHLKLSGHINSKDFDVLDDMCTCWCDMDEDDNHIVNIDEPPFLKYLDLGDCLLLPDYPYLPEFTYYSKLEKFVSPRNLESTTDLHIFENSQFLKQVVLSDTLKEIGNSTFLNCVRLEEIDFPESLERIGSFSFCHCESLKIVKIPANVSQIECAAFSGCYSLEKFEVDVTNPYFSEVDGVIYNKDLTKLIAFPCGLKSNHYSIPEGTKVIVEGSFLAAQIESISFPSTLEIIEGWSFRHCRNLKSIEIPDSVTEIGELAFQYCTSLTHVKLSKQVTTLNPRTFYGCESLNRTTENLTEQGLQ